ncbi:MAG TPA: M1 family metallopeptidase [Puia sp.]|nr:M1 family metallopeptidase [Puia sp.]
MKTLASLGIFLIWSFGLAAQPAASDTSIPGVYKTIKGPDFTFEVAQNKNGWLLQIVGMGATSMTPLGPLRFEPQHIRPRALIQFFKDSAGNIDRMQFSQGSRTYKWVRIYGDPEGYTGDFQLPANPYRILHVQERNGVLVGRVGDEPERPFLQRSGELFLWKSPTGDFRIRFLREKNGQIGELMSTGADVLELRKVSANVPRISNRVNGFTHADSLQGGLTPLRTCYDVLFYDLDLEIYPETKSIRGSNVIRFRAVNDLDRLQIDLHENLKIDSILYHGLLLSYTRDCNAVFVQFPGMVRQGSIDSLKVIYNGVPLEPDMQILRGGVFWVWNRDRKFWIESVCQGVGANVLWPCKDHLSDRPDSMRITVTVPRGLTDISNGRLLAKTELPNRQTKYVWYVDYPIPSYDVAINIGDYVHFTDVYVRGHDSLRLNFYSQRYNEGFARRFFADAKRMLALYEQDFGPYPFPKDGFNVLESVYAMEHQGAVSIGSMNDPFNSTRHDSAGLRLTFWHECAHEWWGNNVGCRDYADMWIHESFASYAELLNYCALEGRDSALRRLSAGEPGNKEAIIGVYDVNNFHMGDMYLKGERMLNTLRDVIDNDSLWFGILRGIQEKYRYQPVTTDDIVDFFNKATGKDYTYFFDQYLRYPSIPVLVLDVHSEKEGLFLRYKWEANVNNFRMPVKIPVSKDSMGWIYPTTNWQTMEIKNMPAGALHVDTKEFYVGVAIVDAITSH